MKHLFMNANKLQAKMKPQLNIPLRINNYYMRANKIKSKMKT